MADFAQEFAASRAEPGAPAPAGFDAEFAQFRQQQREEQGRFNASVLTAAETTPDQVAKQKYLSTMTGVPMDVVKTAEGQVKALAKLRELQIASQNSPVLRDRLANPEFAMIAQDDSGPLSSVEVLMRGLGSGIVSDFAGGTISGTGRLLEIAQRNLLNAFSATFLPKPRGGGAPTPESLQGPLLGADWRQVGEALQRFSKENIDVQGPQANDFSYHVAKGLGQVGGQIALQLGTGGAASALTLYAQGAEAIGSKIDKDSAGQGAKDVATLGGAAITALTEKYALDKILGPMAVPIKNAIAAAVARVGVAAAAEGGQELVENIGHDVMRKIFTNPDAKIDLGEAFYEGGVGATVGGIVRSLVEASLHVRARGMQREVDQTKREIEQLQKIMQTAAGSQVFELDKQSFAEFVQAAAERSGTAPTSVFVDGRVLADTLAQSGLTDEQINAALPSVRAQLADAVAANSAVEIPIGELTAGVTATPLEQALLPDLRLKANGLSLNEAKLEQQQAQEFLQQQAERVIQQAADTMKMAAGAETVRNTIKAELDAAGRFSSDVNDKGAKLVSQFYTVMADRLKTTPEKLYADLLQYKVLNEQQAAHPLGRMLKGSTLNALNAELKNYKKGAGVPLTAEERTTAEGLLTPLLEQAAAAKDQFDAQVSQIAADLGARPMLASLKSVARASEKLIRENNGDATRMRDLLRATVVVNSLEDVPAAVEAIKQNFEIVQIKDRFANPQPSGYRDVLINVRMPNGTVAEIQVNVPAMMAAKDYTHKLYEMARVLDENDPRVEALDALQKQVYSEAFSLAQNAKSSAVAGEPLNRNAALGNGLSGASANTVAPSASLSTGTPSTSYSSAPLGTSNIGTSYAPIIAGDQLNQAARVVTGRVLFEDIIVGLGITDQELTATAIPWMSGLPGDMAFLPPIPQVGSEDEEVESGGLTNTISFLHGQRLASGLPPLDIKTPEGRETLARLIAAEALAGIRVAGSSLEWYDQTVRTTLALMSLKYPEVNTDPQARTAFLLAVAITSQTMNVEDNLRFASQQYEAYRATVGDDGIGQFPEVGTGKSLEAMANNFKKVNTLLREMGPENLQRFLVTPYTAKELNSFGFNIDENVNEQVLGSAVLGPKIGFGFFSNLNGNFEPVTMDMWFMRTIGRLTGTLPSYDPATFAKQLQRFRSGLDERGDNGVFADRFDQALVERARTDDAAAIELARLVFKAHEKDFKDNRAAFDAKTREKSTIVKAADTMIKSLDKPKDIPANGTERQNLRDVVRQTVALVQQHYGERIPPAALQALIWYPEQELYKALGVKLRVTSQDYAGAARKLLESEGINDDQIAAAIQSAQPGPGQVRPGAGEANAAGAAGESPAPGSLVPFQGDERIRAYVERNQRLLEQRDSLNQAPLENKYQERYRAGQPLESLSAEQRSQYDALAGEPQSRRALGYKDVTQRTEALQRAALQLKSGELTAAQYAALVDRLKPVEAYDEVPQPATPEEMQNALSSDKVERIGVPNQTLEAGHPVGLRLDIPAYSQHGTWVVSVHEQEAGYNAGKSIGYESVARATDVTFGVVEKAALNIASGKPKATIAVMKGGWEPTTPEQGKAAADAALTDPAWVQVGMDPERHSYFYDRATMQPVTGASEVIQIGPLVLAKNPQYAQTGDQLFQTLEEDAQGQMPFLDAKAREAGYSSIDEWAANDIAGFVRAAEEWRQANPAEALAQPARGIYDIGSMTTVLNGTADLSTFLHETGHFFLDAIRRMVASGAATPEVVAMYEGALKGLGVSEEEWNAWHDEYEQTGKISDGMRKAHEKWAETFENYLFTGKAPSVEMRGLFRTFLSWLKRVYTSLEAFTARTGTTLDPDLKAVMDKMLATDQEIAEAEQVAGLLPDMNATAEAQEKLNARSLRDLKWAVNAKNKMIAKLQKEAASLRKAIEDEVRAEVEAMPIYRALRWIKKGELTTEEGEEIKATKGHKLNTEALAEMYPENMLGRPDLAQLKGMTASTGLHPDIIADMIPGWTGNGDQLVRTLIDAQPMSAVIEGMTDQRMLERHGDLATPEAISQAALEAVHNEARAKSLATELAGQRDMINTRRDTGEKNAKGSRITVNVLMEAAKNFAANVIGRRKIGDLKKATWAHVQAERRAGRAWEAATAKGDTAGAVQAKQDQMLNNAAAKAGVEAQAKVRKALELFKKITRGTDEKLVERGYDPDIANAARAVLAAYGIAPSKGKSAVEYLETLQRNDPATYNAVAPSVNAALLNARPFDELTFSDLEALVDEVQSLWHLARRSRQMEIDGNLLDREDVQEDLKSDLETKGIPSEMPGDTSAITPREQAIRKLLVFKAAATRVENWTQGMGAMFTKYVFQPVKEAADRYRAAKTQYLKQYRDLLKAIEPTLKREEIAAPELGYTFGKDTGGIAMQEILHAILNTGNASNKRKLLLGRGWATEQEDGTLDTSRWDAFVQRMIDEGRLLKAHYDFAQGVWDLLESMKPLAQKTHRDVFGRYFAEVTADAFVTPFGAYRGGYVPAIADSRIVSDAATRKLMEEENESMAFAFPATNRGFTKGRVEYNRPLMLDLRTLAQHIDKVLLFSHLELPVRDVRRVLTAKEVAYGLNRIDPAGFDNVVTPWLNRASRQQVETPVAGDAGTMRFFSNVRNRAGLAAMFANFANAAQQITGFSIAAVKVKPSYLLSAAAQMTGSPKEMKQAVADLSVFMRERMENESSNAERAIADILLKPSVYENAKNWTTKHAYFVQQAIDNAMGPVIWTAAFNQATEQGLSEKDAVRFADSVIRTTQGSTLPEDVSRMEGGNAFVRIFTQFASYANMQANLLGQEFAKTARELGVKKGAGRMLYVAVLGGLVPMWMGEAIVQAFRGGPDDEDKDGEYLDDWIAAVFGFGTLRGLTAMIPGVGQLANSLVNSFNSKPYDDRIASSPAISMIESAVSAPHSVYKAIADDGSRQKAVRDVATLLTLLTGLPVTAAARPVGYVAGMSDYHINPTSEADMARGLVTGVASPQSK